MHYTKMKQHIPSVLLLYALSILYINAFTSSLISSFLQERQQECRTIGNRHDRCSSTIITASQGDNNLPQPTCTQPLLYVMDNLLTEEECWRAMQDQDYTGIQRVVSDLLESVLLGNVDAADDSTGNHDGTNDTNVGELRYLDYGDPTNIPTSLIGGGGLDPLHVIPAGLHVDTNNGKLARYATVLVYLTNVPDGAGGATTFPLALPDRSTPWLQNDLNLRHEELVLAAKLLIESRLHHTQIPQRKDNFSLDEAAGLLEGAALDLFQNDMHREKPGLWNYFCSTEALNLPSTEGFGLRVTSRIGRVCLFFTRDENGEVDPCSFHGGESVFDIAESSIPYKKVVINLFKEVGRDKFSSFDEFRDCIKQLHPLKKEFKVESVQ